MRTLLAVTMLVGITTVFAAPAGAATTAVRCDFDGDGVGDLAVGVPGENGYGAVDVLYSTAAPAILLEGWLPPGSAYGAALTCGDFDSDGTGDLAVGAPGAYEAAGKVFVYAGAAGVGLGTMTMFSQGSGTPGSYAADDRMGWSLAAGDLGGDGYDDLVVGLPGDEEAGSVLVIRGGAHGLRFDRSVAQLFGGDQAKQEFGWSLAVGQFEAGGGAELAVGAPYADVGSVAQGGQVHTFTDGRRADRVFDQNDTQIGPGVELHDRFGWSLAAGDLDGDGHDDLAVGTPFEDVGAVADAGEVDVLSGGTDSLGGPDTTVDVVVQASSGGAVEAGDWFGYAVAAGDVVGDGRADLAVGAPHENGWTGAYSLFPGTGSLIGAGTVAIGPHPTSRLGMSVAVVAGDLLAGLPGEPGPAAMPGAANCGAVLIADTNPQVLHQDTVAPAVAGVREVGWTPMPWDDTLGEPADPDAEPGGEWFGWSVAQ